MLVVLEHPHGRFDGVDRRPAVGEDVAADRERLGQPRAVCGLVRFGRLGPHRAGAAVDDDDVLGAVGGGRAPDGGEDQRAAE